MLTTREAPPKALAVVANKTTKSHLPCATHAAVHSHLPVTSRPQLRFSRKALPDSWMPQVGFCDVSVGTAINSHSISLAMVCSSLREQGGCPSSSLLHSITEQSFRYTLIMSFSCRGRHLFCAHYVPDILLNIVYKLTNSFNLTSSPSIVTGITPIYRKVNGETERLSNTYKQRVRDRASIHV